MRSAPGPSILAGLALAGGVAVAAVAGGSNAAAAGPRAPNAGWYWERPIPAQGSPPESHLGPARSLAPRDCAACHPRQFADWKTSLHGQAFSPGLEWQLLEMPAADRASCLSCHAPMTEQLDHDLRGRQNPSFDAGLKRAGVACAACHVREHVRYGPPRKPGHDPGISFPGKPHGEVIRSNFFESANFCAACHQFPPEAEAPNGKPLENTVAEWEASPFAARGTSCQSCHMPDRRHLWRGIHDPDMVRNGLTLELSEREARLTNSGVGHMFPTYVTPRVLLVVEALDLSDRVVASRSALIERSVDLSVSPTRELADTRLAPGATLAVPVPDVRGAARVRARVVVYPDHFYQGMFTAASRERHSAAVRALLDDALRRTRESSYVAVSAERRLGPGVR